MIKIEFQITGVADAQRALRIAGFIASDYESEPAELAPLPMGQPVETAEAGAADRGSSARVAARKPRASKADAADPAALYVAAGGVIPAAEGVASTATKPVADHSNSEETTRSYTAEELAAAVKAKPATTEQLVAAVEAKVEAPAPVVEKPVETPADPLAAAVASAPSSTPTQALLDEAKAACSARGALWVREIAGRLGLKSIAECTTAQLEELIKASKVTT